MTNIYQKLPTSDQEILDLEKLLRELSQNIIDPSVIPAGKLQMFLEQIPVLSKWLADLHDAAVLAISRGEVVGGYQIRSREQSKITADKMSEAVDALKHFSPQLASLCVHETIKVREAREVLGGFYFEHILGPYMTTNTSLCLVKPKRD